MNLKFKCDYKINIFYCAYFLLFVSMAYNDDASISGKIWSAAKRVDTGADIICIDTVKQRQSIHKL